MKDRNIPVTILIYVSVLSFLPFVFKNNLKYEYKYQLLTDVIRLIKPIQLTLG